MTGRGLMGQAAFRQLRSMVDSLLARKPNYTDISITGSTDKSKGKWVKFATVDLSAQLAYVPCCGTLEFVPRETPNGPHGTVSFCLRNGATANKVGALYLAWTSINDARYATSLAWVRESDGRYGLWYKPLDDWDTETVTLTACYNRDFFTFSVGSYVDSISPAMISSMATPASSVAWGNVSDRPSTYPPAAHNHDSAYVAKTSAGVSAAINLLAESASTPADNDYYVSQFAGGGTATTTYHRRPMSALWAYIRAKCDALYVAKSGSVGDVVSFTKSLTLRADWQDTGIAGANLATGTYVVQVGGLAYDDGLSTYFELWSGVMSWRAENTNSTEADEVLLHKAGHAPNGSDLFLRTARRVSGTMTLQIAATRAATKADSVTFKFRRLI